MQIAADFGSNSFSHAASLSSFTVTVTFLAYVFIFALGTLTVPVGYSVFVFSFFRSLLWWIKILGVHWGWLLVMEVNTELTYISYSGTECSEFPIDVVLRVNETIFLECCPSSHGQEKTGFTREHVQHLSKTYIQYEGRYYAVWVCAFLQISSAFRGLNYADLQISDFQTAHQTTAEPLYSLWETLQGCAE